MSQPTPATQPTDTTATALDAAPRKRRPPRRVEVSHVQVLSPAMRRITLRGDELEGFEPTAPASYLKLIFPEPGQNEPARPLPDAPRPTAMRTYTPLAIRPALHEVDVDFVLHGVGPASTWAAQAQIGQVLYLMGPAPASICCWPTTAPCRRLKLYWPRSPPAPMCRCCWKSSAPAKSAR